MSLEDWGARTWASLREIQRDDAGEVVCPVSEIPITYSRGEISVPVVRLADDDLREALEDADVEYVRSRGYESPDEDLLFPEQVGGPDAHGYSSRMVGVRAQLTEGTAWIPVRSDDLEAADRAHEVAHDPTASADGGSTTRDGTGPARTPEATSEPTEVETGNEATISERLGEAEPPVGVFERPDVVDELGLPTEYEDGHPRFTYVGHCQEDDVDVYAGRHGDEGSQNLVTVDEPGEAGWLGNPYPADDFGREQSVAMFTSSLFLALEQRPEFVDAVYQLRGNVLGCWCHRLEDTGEDHPVCHADVIARVADRVLKRRPEGDQGGDQV
ncbi:MULTISPECIES: DUF4326 domain-containing protein [Halorussus]|uniref:DUF4326 domain-containing protein n=1 Tax=Halorussus TaxID=1070314 RepID=UPI0013B3CB7B|nr:MULTISPECIES: DUF4326 domain-containing protein [Halorussus]NHN59832.1 DUF4326 domain-containing protein [Halorussus sp. JP-T4]